MSISYLGNPLFEWNGGITHGRAAPTVDSVYRIGSVTKVFAWVLAMIAEAKGLVNLDDPVKKTVPELELIDKFFIADGRNSFTWNQLASHMAGLPREAPCLILNCTVTTEEMLQRLRTSHLKLPPNITPYYSNLGFSLLGRLIAERVLGGNFEDLVQQLILDPLQMKNTSFTPPTTVVPPVPPQPLLDFKWSSPSGQMYSTARDMQKLNTYLTEASQKFFSFSNPYNPFAAAQDSSHRANSVMSSEPSNLLGIRNDKIRLSMFPRFINPDSSAFSAPWEMSQVGGYTVRAKGGNVNRYSASMATIPDLRLSLSFLTNAAVDEVAVVNQIFGIVTANLTKALYSLQTMPSPPSKTAPYVGKYFSPNGGLAVIVVDLLGNLILSLQGFGNVVLVPTTFDPINTGVLQIYIPEYTAGLSCMTRELLSVSYEVVEFTLGTEEKASAFSIPGYLYGALWSRTE